MKKDDATHYYRRHYRSFAAIALSLLLSGCAGNGAERHSDEISKGASKLQEKTNTASATHETGSESNLEKLVQTAGATNYSAEQATNRSDDFANDEASSETNPTGSSGTSLAQLPAGALSPSDGETNSGSDNSGSTISTNVTFAAASTNVSINLDVNVKLQPTGKLKSIAKTQPQTSTNENVASSTNAEASSQSPTNSNSALLLSPTGRTNPSSAKTNQNQSGANEDLAFNPKQTSGSQTNQTATTNSNVETNLAPTGQTQNQNALQPVPQAELSQRYESSDQTAEVSEQRSATNRSQAHSEKSSGSGSAINLDDAFLKMVAESSLADLEFARLGGQQADSKDLKDWCDEKKREANDDLKYVKWLAQQKSVSLPDEPNLKHQLALKQLEDFSDRALAAQFLSDTAELLGQTQIAIGKLRDPKIQSAAKEMKISERSNLSSAKDKAEKIGLGKGLVQEIVRVQLEAVGAATLSPDLLPASLTAD